MKKKTDPEDEIASLGSGASSRLNLCKLPRLPLCEFQGLHDTIHLVPFLVFHCNILKLCSIIPPWWFREYNEDKIYSTQSLCCRGVVLKSWYTRAGLSSMMRYWVGWVDLCGCWNRIERWLLENRFTVIYDLVFFKRHPSQSVLQKPAEQWFSRHLQRCGQCFKNMQKLRTSKIAWDETNDKLSPTMMMMYIEWKTVLEAINKYDDERNETKFMCSPEGTQRVWTMRASPTLHAIASWNLYALLESNCSHGSSFVGVGHEFSLIVSNAKDEPWS